MNTAATVDARIERLRQKQTRWRQEWASEQQQRQAHAPLETPSSPINTGRNSHASLPASSSSCAHPIDPRLCPLCNQINTAPFLLIPCTHTFCASCLVVRTAKTCPSCGVPFESMVKNWALEQIVATSGATHSPNLHIESTQPRPSAAAMKRQYENEVQMIHTRCTVLAMESEKIKESMEQTRVRIRTQHSLIAHINERIEMLQRERQSHTEHIAEETHALNDLQRRLDMTHETLDSLKQKRREITVSMERINA